MSASQVNCAYYSPSVPLNAFCKIWNATPLNLLSVTHLANSSKEIIILPIKKRRYETIKGNQQIKWCASSLISELRFSYIPTADIPFYTSKFFQLLHLSHQALSTLKPCFLVQVEQGTACSHSDSCSITAASSLIGVWSSFCRAALPLAPSCSNSVPGQSLRQPEN